ncbi:MAG TPA: hypothetical protein VF228_25985 [Iamia sp.]
MSYPPGGYGGYQQPGYGGGYGGQVEHPQGTMVLVLGILGIVACQLVAPFAWVMGNRALEEIDRDPLRYSNRSNVNVGRILGMVGTILLGVTLVLVVLVIVLNVVLIGASSST